MKYVVRLRFRLGTGEVKMFKTQTVKAAVNAAEAGKLAVQMCEDQIGEPGAGMWEIIFISCVKNQAIHAPVKRRRVNV